MLARMLRVHILFVFLILATAASVAQEKAVDQTISEGTVTVEDPWVREAAPEALMLTGYMVLKNTASEPWILTRTSSRDFKMMMIHRWVLHDGFRRMNMKSEVRIPPDGGVIFGPQGYHLMLMGPKREFKKDDEIEITLQFSEAESMRVIFPVREKPPADNAGTAKR